MISNDIINKVNNVLAQLQAKNVNLAPVMTKVATIIANMIDTNFNDGGRWDGEKPITILSGGSQQWEPLSEGYKSRLVRQGGQDLNATLYRSGELRSSLEVNSTDSGVVVSANKVYARRHQLGDESGGTMPARPYLTLRPEDMELIIAEITKFVVSH